MEVNELENLSYDKLRTLFKDYLQKQDIAKTTVNTAYVNSFYLWRKGSRELFWNAVTADDFDTTARSMLMKVLSENSSGNVTPLVNGYLSHLKRFHTFVCGDQQATVPAARPTQAVKKKKSEINVPNPSLAQIEHYLAQWNALENYRLQEDALDILFFKLCPKNTDISDILLKASSLNDFYSTNIFSIYPVAKHILAINIDDRLMAGDVTLVGDIQHIIIGGVNKNFYSFATKYCSHHNSLDYPIYDKYVDDVLRYFRNRDCFSEFADGELKDYVRFKAVMIDFRDFYRLGQYNLKQIDKYLWQLGKDYFPKNYSKKKGR